MKSQLTKHKFHWMGLFLVCLFVVNTGSAPAAIDISIQVSPAVLNLQNNGKLVTVHTSIAYGLVDGSTVVLNDVEIYRWKSDDRGYFVAKFRMKDIQALPFDVGEENTFTLMGYTKTGDLFIGSDEVKIIDVLSKKK